MAEEPISEWRDPTPSASSSTSLESQVSVAPRPTKKHHTEDEHDLTYQPRDDEVESARSQEWIELVERRAEHPTLLQADKGGHM